MTVRLFVALLPLLLSTSAAGTNQVLLRYLAIGYQGSARLLTADKAGNLFTVSTITNPSGRPRIRAIKMDAKGNPLASIDFGGGGLDRPAAAATDPQGNLVVVGTAVSNDFPSVAPLFSPSGSGGAFVVKLDSQLHAILFSTLLSSRAAATAVALDAAGNVFLAGDTTDPNFPLTAGAYRTKPPVVFMSPISSSLGFLTEISPNGDRLLYSTYFGGDSANCLGGSRCVGVLGTTTPLGLAVRHSGDGRRHNRGRFAHHPWGLRANLQLFQSLPGWIPGCVLSRCNPGAGLVHLCKCDGRITRNPLHAFGRHRVPRF